MRCALKRTKSAKKPSQNSHNMIGNRSHFTKSEDVLEVFIQIHHFLNKKLITCNTKNSDKMMNFALITDLEEVCGAFESLLVLSRVRKPRGGVGGRDRASEIVHIKAATLLYIMMSFVFEMMTFALKTLNLVLKMIDLVRK